MDYAERSRVSELAGPASAGTRPDGGGGLSVIRSVAASGSARQGKSNPEAVFEHIGIVDLLEFGHGEWR